MPGTGAGRKVWRAAPVLPLLAVVVLLAVPPPDGGPGGTGGTVADAASGLLVVYTAARLLRDRARPLSRTAAVVLGLPVLGVCAAAVASYDPAASLPGVVRYLQVFVLVPAAVVLLLRDRRDFRLTAWALVGLALAQGAVGTVQNLTGTGASYMGEDVRAVGTFGAADVMGMATAVAYGLVAAVALALGSPGRRGRAVALGCAALLLFPLVVSFSRGAWIATVAACALLLVLSGPLRALRVALVAGAAGVVLVAGLGVGSQPVTERVASISQVTDAPDRSVTDRYTMWAAAVGMWRSEPLTGVGLKGFPEYRDAHASLALSSGSDIAGAGRDFARQPLLSPHNMYLLILGEQGLLGLLALAGGWLALLVCGLRRLRAAPDGARPGPGSAGRWGAPVDCGLVAVGLLGWQLVDFAYADIGGPATVLTSLVLGLAGWWALEPGARIRAGDGVRGVGRPRSAERGEVCPAPAGVEGGAVHG
ncbi:O-antigen ligase family protein [Streptomyces lichenis]|uniref:O-antigen ligase family protein n=1 Tax=Streptomyces lichenis TaxID=2306967 RepID=A0ABT0I9C8_9ACTN|nr:O-antigen ligase family protein [Streptomyces lichenis]MCK8677918.1 O-antigen ligase family protein [Streptomyces lichenis]